MQNIVIRAATIDDCAAAHALITELAIYEKAPHEVTNTVYDMQLEGFGTNPSYSMHVAELQGQVVGIAIYFIKYSTWKGKGVYLDDIVVTQSLRGKGIGKLLFNAVIKYAQQVHAKQLHWQVLDWNTPAINFYNKYHAQLDSQWINCKLSEAQINTSTLP